MSERSGAARDVADTPGRPCAGMKVLDLTQGMAGPLAAMLLADHGAEVVKVEPPTGDWARHHLRGFHMWNRGKRSVVLDLSDPASRERLDGLVVWADVVLTDVGPVHADRLRLRHRDLRSVNPRIVHAHVGIWAGADDDDRPTYAATFAAATGQMVGLDLLSGRILDPARPDPTFYFPPTAAYGAAMLATQAILAATLHRPADLEGEYLETSLLQGAMAFLMRQELARPVPPRPTGGPDLMHRGIELCFLTAECADGRYVQMCARQDHHFRAWLEALELAHVLDDPRFAGAPLRIDSFEAADELEALLRDRMRRRTQAEWMEIFTSSSDIGVDPFLTGAEFLRHPQMLANGRVAEVDDPTLGRTTQVGAIVEIDGVTPTSYAPAPQLGEHAGWLAPEWAANDGVEPPGSTLRAKLPLDGITVLEVAYFVAAPLATSMMAELGARVIKVEPLQGDPYRRTGLQAAKFLHGKESIAVDLKHPDGRAVLHDLIRGADALVHSFRLGVPERLGLDVASAHAINPALVYLNAASYGSRGPEAGRVAFHSTPTALSGAGVIQAGEGNPPVDDSFPDPAAGLGAAVGLLLGLHERARTGQGCSLETTMITSAGYVMSNELVMTDDSTHGLLPDAEQLGVGALYRLYPCRTGWLFVGAVTQDAWVALVDVLGLDVHGEERFGTIEGRHRHADALVTLISERLATDDAPTWSTRLDAADVSNAVVDDAGFERWLEAHDMLEPTSHPTFGEYYRTIPKVRFPDRQATYDASACAVGEQTVAILAGLGRSPSEIERLVADGVVAGPAPAD